MHRVVVVYGSQTGTAKNTAYRLGRELYRHRHDYTILPMNELNSPADLARERYVVFICATAGDGEFPDNSRDFWTQLLRADLPATLLENVHCAVLGLGDSSYERFNYAGKKLHRRLEQLGARFICPRADGDDQAPLGLDSAFTPWSQALLGSLAAGSPPPGSDNGSGAIQGLLPPLVRLVPSTETTVPAPTFNAIVAENHRITAPDHFQDVRHLTFTLCEPTIYYPGDVAVLSPRNDPATVTKILDRLGWAAEADRPIRIVANRPEAQLPSCTVTTLRRLLEEHLDLVAPPQPYFFEILSYFVPPEDALHREKLAELASPGGTDLYLDYGWRPRRTPLEVLLDFEVVKSIPASYVMDLFGPMRAREYSIASAWRKHGSHVQLCAALVAYKTILPEMRVGLCSQWLAQLDIGARLNISIRRNAFKLPPIPNTPIILGCSGTGIAPMRALIHHLNSGPDCPPIYLFFGCRYLDRDFHYAPEWREISSLVLFARGSRQGSAKSRFYLADLFLEQAPLVRSLLDRGAYLYVAGNSRLPPSVKGAIAAITQDPSYPASMVRSGRLQVEAWS